MTSIIDPVCVFHSKKASEHVCLYCAICYEDLTIEECHVLPNGEREDICDDCATREAEHVTN